MASRRLSSLREFAGEIGPSASPPRFAVHAPFISLNAD
jgi:hypothetical protein